MNLINKKSIKIRIGKYRKKIENSNFINTNKNRRRKMDDDKKFWISDPENGFKLGRLVDIGTDSWTIQPFDAPGKVLFLAKYPIL